MHTIFSLTGLALLGLVATAEAHPAPAGVSTASRALFQTVSMTAGRKSGQECAEEAKKACAGLDPQISKLSDSNRYEVCVDRFYLACTKLE